MHVQGIVYGKHIELTQALELPRGSWVEIDIKPKELSLAEKKNLLDSLCGSWANDESLKLIFSEIEANRNIVKGREVNFQ